MNTIVIKNNGQYVKLVNQNPLAMDSLMNDVQIARCVANEKNMYNLEESIDEIEYIIWYLVVRRGRRKAV